MLADYIQILQHHQKFIWPISGGQEVDESRPAAALAAIDVSAIKAEPGKGCPRCGGKVFMAEEINARGRVRVHYLSKILLVVASYQYRNHRCTMRCHLSPERLAVHIPSNCFDQGCTTMTHQ